MSYALQMTSEAQSELIDRLTARLDKLPGVLAVSVWVGDEEWSLRRVPWISNFVMDATHARVKNDDKSPEFKTVKCGVGRGVRALGHWSEQCSVVVVFRHRRHINDMVEAELKSISGVLDRTLQGD